MAKLQHALLCCWQLLQGLSTCVWLGRDISFFPVSWAQAEAMGLQTMSIPCSCPRAFIFEVLKDRLCITCVKSKATFQGEYTGPGVLTRFTCVILDLEQQSILVQQVHSPGDCQKGDLENLRMIHSVCSF